MDIHDENDDPSHITIDGGGDKMQDAMEQQGGEMGIGLGDLKRNRDDILGQWANEDEVNASPAGMDVDSPKRIAALPKRGSPASSSSSSSSSPFGRNRNNAAATLPISAGLSSYLSSAQDSQWTAHDFSSFTNRSDF